MPPARAWRHGESPGMQNGCRDSGELRTLPGNGLKLSEHCPGLSSARGLPVCSGCKLPAGPAGGAGEKVPPKQGPSLTRWADAPPLPRQGPPFSPHFVFLKLPVPSISPRTNHRGFLTGPQRLSPRPKGPRGPFLASASRPCHVHV